MASIASHFAIGATLALPFTTLPSIKGAIRPIWVVLGAGIAASAPDVDALFIDIIPYAHFWGHRGFIHSPFFPPGSRSIDMADIKAHKKH